MSKRAGRNLVSVAACLAALLLTVDGALGQARVGLGGVRAAGPRMGGFSRAGGAPRAGGSFRPMSASARSGAFVGGGSCFTPCGPSIVGDTGLTIRGAYADDNFRLKFRLGSATGLTCPPHPDFCPTFPVYSLGLPYWDYWSDGGYPIDGYYAPVDPQLVGYTPRPNPTPQAVEPPPPTDLQIGASAVYWGEPERAAVAYRNHIRSNPEDVEAIRALGLALIDAKELKEGVAVFALAYRKDPSLADRPMPFDTFSRPDAFRRNFVRVSIWGRNTGSASAWLAAAALAQAEGRRDVAARMVERAREAGLEQTVADRMIAAVAR